ncbi:hypothetical protein D3C81_1883600 [compost metagenome]
MLALHIATDQADFQRHSRFTQGFPQQRLVAVFLLRATGQDRGQPGVGQTVENAGHVVQFRLYLRASSETGQLSLPDLPDLKLLAQEQHRQLGRLAHGDFLEFTQRVIGGDDQGQFVFVQQHAMQPRLAWR